MVGSNPPGQTDATRPAPEVGESPSEERPPGFVDRLLRVFGDVRAGEGATALLMCLNVFLLLMAYYVLKTAREPLVLLASGAELKSYAAAAQALTLVLYAPLYGWVAQKLPRQTRRSGTPAMVAAPMARGASVANGTEGGYSF